MSGRDYCDRGAWKTAFCLSLAIYEGTSFFPADERYGLTSQLRRAGVSIPSNIAEGQGRRKGEFLRYLTIALGSLKELETQLLISDALGFFRSKQASKLLAMAAEVSRVINGLCRS
jgi:four helix bundle protein